MWNLIHAILFILLFKIEDIYIATTGIIISTFLELLFNIIIKKTKPEKMKLFTFIFIWSFGFLTLFLRDPLFIMIKPSILYTIIGFSLIISQFIKKPLISIFFKKSKELEHISDSNIKLFSYLIGVLYLILSLFNIYFAIYTTENIWLNFKVLSGIGLGFATILLIFYISSQKTI